MPKSKSIFRAFKSSLRPLLAPGNPSATSNSGLATSTTSVQTTPKQDLVLSNLAAACRISKDIAEAFDEVPYIKAVTGVVNQIIQIHEEVQGNKERCNEIISMVEECAYTIVECLGDLYAAEGESRLEGLKAELTSFQSYLEYILLNNLEPLKKQSRWKAYVKRDTDGEDMRRIERKLTFFVGRFTMKSVVVGVREASGTQPKLTEIQQTILREQWFRSRHAQYNIDIMDATPGSVDRAYCAPDTREPILERITTWACDRNPSCPAIFWMVGEGGAGKSTIARTIAMKFDEDAALPPVVTFFCSRKFTDTNQQVHIIPTIAYRLAKLCPFYASELLKDANIVDSLEIITNQMDSLLTQPWESSSSSRSTDVPPFLVIVDALDEIVSQGKDGTSGGYAFLKSLLAAVEQGYLKGIKFFITSRPHPELAKVYRSLPSEAICCLFDIPTDQVEQDINRYLQHRLPDLQTPADSELLRRIAAKADGLFIFASTAVRMADPTSRTTKKQQRKALQGVLNGLARHNVIASPVNNLYCQVLRDAFQLTDDDDLSDRLDLLHTIICTEDRVSIDVLVNLVLKESDDQEDVQEMVEDLLSRLHAVLSISEGRITWYHASFLDFLLSPASTTITLPGRILDASCNLHSQNALLARRCFRIMRSQLKFNICQLPSSFLLDSEVEDIERRMKDHISHVLRYACRYWAIHTSKSVGEEVQEDIEEFLDQKVLFWIEAMNLVQQSGLCASLLKVVRQYTLRHFPEASDLRKDLSAAVHFSTVFKGSPASKSSPHLYMSTLVYTAPRFPLLQKWRARFEHLPAIYTTGIGTQLLMTLNGHSNFVNSVAFSPDGTRVVSGSSDHTIRIWDVELGEEIAVLKGKMLEIASVAFSPDGTRIVSGSLYGAVGIWDVETGEKIRHLTGHIKSIESVTFSSDGARIVSGSSDCSIRVWDVALGEQIMALNGHAQGVTFVAFSLNCTRIVSCSYDHSVRIWDAKTGEEVRVLTGHTNWVKAVAISPDGTRIVSGSADSSARVWDIESGESIKTLNGHTSVINSIAFSSDGTRIVSGSDDYSVRVWDVDSGEEIKEMKGHTQRVNSVAFSSDGTRIASGSDDRSVRVWDAESGEKIKVPTSHSHTVGSVASSPDGTLIAFSSERSVRLWDVETRKEIKVLKGHTETVASVAFSSDGLRIVSGSYDNSVRVWNVELGKEVKALSGHTYWVKCAAFSRDGTRIASGSFDNSVRVWNVEMGEEIRRFSCHTKYVHSVIFSLDGTRIVSGSSDNSMRVWDVELGQEIRAHKPTWFNSIPLSPDVQAMNPTELKCVALSSDGTRIAFGSVDGSVRVWDVETGEEVKNLTGHKGSVNSVTFSSDGIRIVSGSDDCTVRVWDVELEKEIKQLDGHSKPVKSVAFLDNTRIVSGSNDRSVRVWDFSSADELQKVESSTHDVGSTSSAHKNTIDSGMVFSTPPQHQLDWTVTNDGWVIQSGTKNRIMWLPDTLTAHLYRPANTWIISQQTATLDLVGAEFGLHWRL